MYKNTEEYMRRSWAEVDLDVLVNNYRIYREHLPEPAEIMAVVKANAYGHGSRPAANALQDAGVRHFAVASLQEAVKLREYGIRGEILILGYTSPAGCATLMEYDIVQALVSEEHAEAMASAAAGLAGNGKGPLKCHFAIDTGMNRIGLDAEDPEHCAEVLRRFSSCPDISLCGIFTHLCTADTDDEESVLFTLRQRQLFDGVRQAASDLDLPECHCLNSAGGLTFPANEDAYVRLGIILYGLKPDYSNVLPEGIRPVLEWKSTVALVKTLLPGETVGYGRTFRADREMKVATIPTGYADGYSRALSNRGYVLIRGKRAKVVGRVCMDQMMVDVTGIPDVRMGDQVVLLGRSGDEYLSADDMAQMTGTIGYELVCDISGRVLRIYKGSGK